ncbi:MAG: DUF3488 and transglutaminase-like domain-containing protein [Desulfuromonadaceae bacterium]|nr:DUF3488 and transglutaminase-like domain-containing protein [Desulfuromonadaceae bacterium]MDD2846870.1 DUF3488 and transglutaminase-like domain-containing protein [Desulfuromonadaceae bacterium]MDD4129152.1 DUF3488 and transglutaminase-like domain-containing protein [Desulfuromonadaceae bacterium]
MVAIRSLTTILTYAIGLCGMIPLFPWLTAMPRTILLVGVISGVWQDRSGRWPLRPWMQNVVIVPVFFFYAMQFSSANPIQPVISVLAIMLAVRLSGEKTVRYSLQIYVLSMFCLASSSLFDLSPVFLLYLGVLLFVVSLALVLLTFQKQDQAIAVTLPDLKKILAFGLLMPLLSVPLLLFFFPIMPRTQLPLWHFLNPQTATTSGYSDTVEPGNKSSITVSGALVFRAEMPQQGQSQPYWRGTVFNRTDGIKWTRIAQVPVERPVITIKPVSQVIYPEPTAIRTLIALDRPTAIALQRVKRSPDGVFELIGSAGKRLSYTADSLSSGVIAQRNQLDSQFYLQLPERLPARIKALAETIVRTADDDRTRVKQLENYFRNGGYRYSTKDLPTGDSAMEQFIFDKKQGHCEFFASSFALLLRAVGVPCRVVGGYLGGEYNQLGGYYLVTEDRAHVWVEAYINGGGWTRIDPSSFATNAGDVWKAPEVNTLKLNIRQAFDSFNHAWNRLVITYDFEQQIKIAADVGSRLQGINATKILRSSVPYFAVMLLVAALFFAVRRTSFFYPRERRILNRFLRTVELKFGVSAGDKGLFEIAAATDNEDVLEFVGIYARAVYHDCSLTDNEYKCLQQILQLLKG